MKKAQIKFRKKLKIALIAIAVLLLLLATYKFYSYYHRADIAEARMVEQLNKNRPSLLLEEEYLGPNQNKPVTINFDEQDI